MRAWLNISLCALLMAMAFPAQAASTGYFAFVDCTSVTVDQNPAQSQRQGQDQSQGQSPASCKVGDDKADLALALLSPREEISILVPMTAKDPGPTVQGLLLDTIYNRQQDEALRPRHFAVVAQLKMSPKENVIHVLADSKDPRRNVTTRIEATIPISFDDAETTFTTTQIAPKAMGVKSAEVLDPPSTQKLTCRGVAND